MTPEQFWRLHPLEFWWMADARRPVRRFGRMTESEAAEIYDDMVALGEF